ncbi:hypothetical protein BGX26_005579, partial [Mortierella sp. AD094]
MSGCKGKNHQLPRNQVIPPIELQRTIFPWIEYICGPPGTDSWQAWQKECEEEMMEIDENETDALTNLMDPLDQLQDGQMKSSQQEREITPTDPELTEPIEEPNHIPPSNATSTIAPTGYGTNEVYKRAFLKLLVRCRSVILHDAAVLLYYNLKNHYSKIRYYRALFDTFAKQVIEAIESPSVDPLQQYEEAMPIVANEIRSTK